MNIFSHVHWNCLFQNFRKSWICLLTLISFLFFNQCASMKNMEEKKVNEPPKEVKQSRQTKYILPPGYKNPRPRKLTRETKNWRVLLFARSWRPGESVYMELRSTAEGKKPYVSAFNKEVQLTTKEFGYSALFAIPPETKPGKHNLTFKSNKDEQKVQIKVSKANFPTSTSSISLKKVSDLTKPTSKSIKNQIKRERALQEKLYLMLTDNKLTPDLAHPMEIHRITGKFYQKRRYKMYKMKNGKKVRLPSKTSIHTGLDLAGRPGMSVYAMARGKVVLSRKMYYEGNILILDHGNQVYTTYVHLSSRNAKVGQMVEAGEKIGQIGSTGAVEGQNLHLAVTINGEFVDPLSFLTLPIQ